MKIDILRFSSTSESTFGILKIDNIFYCYTLENTEKIIPCGSYNLGFRNEGGLYALYLSKFIGHLGMLEIKNVPFRTHILLHIGNTIKDSLGCILLGDTVNVNTFKNGFLGSSKEAYLRVYRKISSYLLNNNDVILNIKSI